MKTLSELIDELRSIDPAVPANVTAYEILLAEVVACRTPDAVVPLLGLLRDDARYDELMFSIIHGIEIFDDRIYVNQILNGTADLCDTAPRWASIIFMRMLNSESTRRELIRQLPNANPRVKSLVRTLMEKINARGVQFSSKTSDVLVATAAP